MIYNVQATVLKMLLSTNNSTAALEIFSRLHKDHFNDAFSSIYKSVQNYYKKHNTMPSIDSLLLESNRNARLSQALTVLAHTDVPNVDINHAISVLDSEYTQDLLLQLIQTDVLDDLTSLDQGEILNRVASLHLKLEEKVSNKGKVFNADTMRIFQKDDIAQLNMIPLGISNTFDANIGLARKETILIGGWRGTGKSIICSNLQVNQYVAGKVAPYFTIEMPSEEVFKRNLAIMAGVSAKSIRNNALDGDALTKLAFTRAGMFNGGEELFREYIGKYTLNQMSDYYDLESQLMESFELHTPMIIIHDPELSIATVDVESNKLAAKYGKDLTLLILDYINQTRLPDTKTLDMYDWKQQMIVSSTFKGICQKTDTAGAAPIQIDQQGNARMSKGVMDSADMAINLNAAKADNGKGGILFNMVKSRQSDEIKFMSPIDWNTLKIDNTQDLTMLDIQEMQAEFVIPIEEPRKPRKAKAKEESTSDENQADI